MGTPRRRKNERGSGNDGPNLPDWSKVSDRPKSNRPKSNQQRVKEAAATAKKRKSPGAKQKELLNLAGNTQRMLNEGVLKGQGKKETIASLKDVMEGYSMKDVRRLQKTQQISPITIGALRKAKLLSGPKEDSGLLSEGFETLKDAGGWALKQISRPGQAVLSGLAEWNRDAERSGNIFDVGDVLGAAGEGFLHKRKDTPVSMIKDTVRIRRKQGRDTKIFGFINPKHLTTGVGGFATNLIGSIATDPSTYLTLGGTAAAKAAIKSGTLLTAKSLAHTGKGVESSLKLAGHLRARGSLEDFGKLLVRDGVDSASAGKLVRELTQQIAPKGLPAMGRGVRWNPMGIPGKKMVQKMGVRLGGGERRIAKAVAAGRTTPELAAEVLASGKRGIRRGAIGDIRSIRRPDKPILTIGKTGEKKLASLLENHPGITNAFRGRLNAFGNFARQHPILAQRAKEIKAESEAEDLAFRREAHSLADAEKRLTPGGKRVAASEDYTFVDGKLYEHERGSSYRELVEPGYKPLGGGNALTELDISIIGNSRGFFQRNSYRLQEGNLLRKTGPNADITTERYLPHILKVDDSASEFLRLNSGIPDAIKARKIQGTIPEINQRLADGTFKVIRDGKRVALKDLKGFDPTAKPIFQFETDLGQMLKRQADNQSATVENLAMAKGFEEAGLAVKLDAKAPRPAGHYKIEAPAVKRDPTSMHTILGVQDGQSLYIPNALKKDMDTLAEVFAKQKGGPLRNYDKFLALWKGYATVPFPLSTGFTLRNSLGNYIANYMEGSVELSHYASALRLQRMGLSLGADSKVLTKLVGGETGPIALSRIIQGSRYGKDGLTNPRWIDDLFKEFPILKQKNWTKNDIQLYHDAVQSGSVSKQFSFVEAGAESSSVARPAGMTDDQFREAAERTAAEEVRATGKIKRFAARHPVARRRLAKINPADRTNKALDYGTRANSGVENNARFAHFIAKREQGFSVADSAASVRKYLFDYNDLSSVERRIFKRVSPFYTFTRKSVPLYAEMFITQPGKFNRIGYVQKSVAEQAQYQSEDVPEWNKEERGVPLPQTITDTISKIPLLGDSFKKGTPAVLNPDLPFKNLLRFANLAGGLKDLTSTKSIRNMFAAAGIGGPAALPLIAAQMATGKNIFTSGSLEDSAFTNAPLWAKWLPKEATGSLITYQSTKPGGKKVATMKEKDIFLFENLWPLLSKVRTLPGFTESTKDLSAAGRRGLSMLTGLSVYPTDAATRGTAYKSDTERLREQTEKNKGQGFYNPRAPTTKSRKAGGPRIKYRMPK